MLTNDELNEKERQLREEEYALEDKKQLAEITKQLPGLSKDKSSQEELLELVKAYERTGNQLRYIQNSQEARKRPDCEKKIQKSKDKVAELETASKKTELELKEKTKDYEDNKGVLVEIKQLDLDIENRKDEINTIKQNQAGAKADLQNAKKRRQELEEKLQKMEDTIRRKQLLDETQSWLDKCFIPSVDDIERHMLATLNEEFNQLFQQWFNSLIETGDIAVEVDDAFSPSITQNGYQIQVNNLSGGERTSVALAYRLALNALIRRTASLKGELLILDEPTDGFSSEQLIKLRQVLEQLNVAQLIMVSHEKELESFVDNVYKVTKEGGISKVTFVNA